MATIRWTARDRYGNDVHLFEEAWQHVIVAENHPEMADFEAQLRDTIRLGSRKQDALNPRKYRYSHAFGDLCEDNTHLVAIVLCGYRQDASGRIAPHNYVVTAYQKEVG